ncbi:MAG: NTP transferase domain-containing protein [FCB group bacterium]|nr:NTP transferase domain-containing protein [FCB group bacterium]
MEKPLIVAILAAGKGTRMKSDLPKVLHPVGGKPMVLHVIRLARNIGADRVIAIIGHQKKKVIETICDSGAEWVVQEPQLGTGHAVQQVEPLLKDQQGDLLVLSGDVPLLREYTLNQLMRAHRQSGAAATLLTAQFADPSGYGRILRNKDNGLERIVEDKDCSPEESVIREINAGIYVFQVGPLFEALKQVNNQNAQGEYYLPDTLPILISGGFSVGLEILQDPLEIQGVNTPQQLNEINRIFRTRYENNTG